MGRGVTRREFAMSSSDKVPVFGRQVTTQLSLEQGRLLDQLASERQLSVSAIVREAVREYLAAAGRPVALAR